MNGINSYREFLNTKFTRLLALERVHIKPKRTYIRCLCDCGRYTITRFDCLVRGEARSCGCLMTETTARRARKHGKHGSPVWVCWVNMKRRATGKIWRKTYYDRGITVCNEWLNFETFFKDMGEPPTKLHTLERIDNNKGYYKENCCWATRAEQAINTRTALKIVLEGEVFSLTTARKREGIGIRIFNRVRKHNPHLTIQQIFNICLDNKRRVNEN